ncbi:MAG: plasmid partitioning protein RepB, partial [Beijerinckiaceae bacterium]
EAERLREELLKADRIVEIDPTSIDSSIVRDRFEFGAEEGLAQLAQSIKESGQQVPVLLRPSSRNSGRYEIAYGHRRVAAARKLGIPVKAVVRALSDDELVIAQGKENLERQDLSYIERASFARNLEDGGFSRPTIMAALGVGKGDLSVLISVARDVPEEVMRVVGPAQKIGKPRWLALATACKAATGLLLKEAIAKAVARGTLPEERFALILTLLTTRPASAAQAEFWVAETGEQVATIARRKGAVGLTIDEKAAPAFGDFIIKHLPELFETYRRQQKG